MNLFVNNLYNSFLDNRDQICLKIGSKTFSYADVLAICNHIREQLKNVKSQNIGLYLTDDVYMYGSILAIWFEGKTYVPIHPDFPVNKNLSVIKQAEIELILSSCEIGDNFNIQFILTTQKDSNINNLPKEFPIGNNAYILFTSGSTGEPKGVPITFFNLHYFSESFSSAFGSLRKDDQVLQMFELTFDLSVMSYLMPWLNGSAIIGLHKKETKFLQILDLLEADALTVALMVPSILNLIIPYLDPEIKNQSLRLNLFCGEALLIKQIEHWRSFIPQAQIYNVYGPTENTIFCTAYKVEDVIKEKQGIISIGKSLTNSKLSFLENGDSEGELLLSGELLAKYYWKNDGRTKEAFIIKEGQTYYKTGDFCFRDVDGDFFYLNRIDFQTKINGFRVELAEIEYFSNQMLSNAISVAIVTKDEYGNDLLTLFINDENAVKQNILNHLKENLSDYCVPSKIRSVKEFPVNTSGKIDRNKLKNYIDDFS